MDIKKKEILIGVAVLLGGIIAGIITRNVLTGILFIVLVGGFVAMSKYMKKEQGNQLEVEEPKDVIKEEVQTPEQSQTKVG